MPDDVTAPPDCDEREGGQPWDVVTAAGRIVRADDPSAGESYADILKRHRLDELTADGERSPPRGEIGVQVKSLIVSRHGRLGQKIVGLSHLTVPAGAFGAPAS